MQILSGQLHTVIWKLKFCISYIHQKYYSLRRISKVRILGQIFNLHALDKKKKKLYSLYSSYLMRQLFHILIILSNFPIPNSSIHRLTYSKLSSPSKNDHFCNTILISRLYATLFSKEYILHSILSSLSFNTNEGSIPPFF